MHIIKCVPNCLWMERLFQVFGWSVETCAHRWGSSFSFHSGGKTLHGDALSLQPRLQGDSAIVAQQPLKISCLGQSLSQLVSPHRQMSAKSATADHADPPRNHVRWSRRDTELWEICPSIPSPQADAPAYPCPCLPPAPPPSFLLAPSFLHELLPFLLISPLSLFPPGYSMFNCLYISLWPHWPTCFSLSVISSVTTWMTWRFNEIKTCNAHTVTSGKNWGEQHCWYVFAYLVFLTRSCMS